MKTIVIREKEYKLSDAQIEAMKKMKNSWQSSYDLQVSLNVLRALQKKGLVESCHRLGSLFSPRNGILWRLS